MRTILQAICLSFTTLTLGACGGGSSGDPDGESLPPVLADPTTPGEIVVDVPDEALESPDAVPDVADSAPDAIPDAADVTPNVTDGTPDAPSDVVGDTPDAAPDVADSAPDATPDVADGAPDAPSDVAGDTPDDTPDVADSPSDVTPDSTQDETPDGTSDVPSDVASDETADVAPDAVTDEISDAAPDETPDATPGATPDETSDATPGAVDDETADGAPDVTPDETSDATPGAGDDETTDVTPDATPDETSDATPDAVDDETTDGTSDATSDETADATPGAGDEETSDATPDAVDDETADATPGDVADGTLDAAPDTAPDETPEEAGNVLPPDAESAGYSVTIQSLWFVEDYPQDFPQNPRDDAHLSLIGGATHNAAVSFWEPGTTPSPGVEDVAETGRIDIFLEEDVRPAITNGTADSTIEFREFTFSSPFTIDLGLPTAKSFDVVLRRDWPLISLVTMLGPSPDWFVGVDGEPLYESGAWRESVTLDLPLYDAGTKEGMSPFMGGPDTLPKGEIGLIAYDVTSGTYGPTDTAQTLARIVFTRTR